MEKTCRFRWIEGGANYHFTYDDATILVEEVITLTYPTRLSRDELDDLMLRYLKTPHHFQGKSAEIFRKYLDGRGIDLPRIPSP